MTLDELRVSSDYDDNQKLILSTAIKSNIPIDKFSNPKYGWKQMKEIMKGVEDGLDVSIYASLDFSWEQMEQIRYGLMEKMDASIYANPNYNPSEMQHIRVAIQLLRRENKNRTIVYF